MSIKGNDNLTTCSLKQLQIQGFQATTITTSTIESERVVFLKGEGKRREPGFKFNWVCNVSCLTDGFWVVA